MNYILEYHQQITSGEITACKKIKKVYQHLAAKIQSPKDDFVFDEDNATFAIDFIEKFCQHSTGEFSSKPFILELWQKALVSAIFGFVHKTTKLRQYREIILIVGRKNGKSTLAAAISLYMLLADGEASAQVYSAATRKEQAKIIWKEAKKMIEQSSHLKKRCKCLFNEIKAPNNSEFFPLANESKSLDGFNPHCALLDEIHEWRDENLYHVIKDGMSMRSQPLILITTTAGFVRDNIYDMKYSEAEYILTNYDTNENAFETVLPIIYELDNKNEWTDKNAWIKANPTLGAVKKIDALEEKVVAAQRTPNLLNNLLTKEFNIRETSATRALTFEQINNTNTFCFAELKPKYFIGGVDLSRTDDLTAATALFKTSQDQNTIYCLTHYFMPHNVWENRLNDKKTRYWEWHKQGLITLNDGNKVDYRNVTKWFLDLQQNHGLYCYKIGYDAWSATYLIQELEETFGRGVLEAVIQGYKTLSIPFQQLKADLTSNFINYNNNPITKFCMVNLKEMTDINGNIRPIKSVKQDEKIDGFMSILDAYTIFLKYQKEYLTLM